MSFLALRAYWSLIQFDIYLTRGNFKALHEKVRAYPITKVMPPAGATEQICAAVDLACIWYWKEVRCLQRSTTTTCLLRSYGVPAQMILGAQQMPFKAHAWVVVGEQVVNDKPYISEIFAVMDRC
jgi:Transglutaminase-like superfamily